MSDERTEQSDDSKPSQSESHPISNGVSNELPSSVSNNVDSNTNDSTSTIATNSTNHTPPVEDVPSATLAASTSSTAATTASTNKVIGKKRKREKTRWGPPPRKKRWGSASQSAKNQSLISNLIKLSTNTNNNHNNTNSASSMTASQMQNAWNEKQTKIFLLKNQLQDISTRLIAPSAFIAAKDTEERSPSPEPVYDQKGVRINTRVYRLREKLQSHRIKIIQEIIELDPNYQPPPDYKPPKLTHKILMPVDEYPDYNFFGLIVGPRGNTQKEMQKETGCKIAVRGQGACLDKPGRMMHPDDNEPLHVHITAPNQTSLDGAIAAINQLLNEVKTGGGEHKAKQLRELATINGTLRIEARCRICGGQHPIYRCPEKTGEKWTPADVQCKICGELTHVTEDCKHYKKGKNIQSIIQNRPSIDAEYNAFMQELIGDGPISSSKPIAAITAPPPKTIIAAAKVAAIVQQNGYHNVPPPNQSGAKPPAQYANNNGAKEGEGDKKEVKNGTQTKQIQAPQMMQPAYGTMMPPMYPMTMPMMQPNIYAMSMMNNAMYGGMRPAAYHMPMNPMNPYMARPPMPPHFAMNPYLAPVPPPPPPTKNGQ